MKNKYFYPIYKLKIKSWIKYWLIKQTEFKGVLSDILEGISFYLTDSLNMKFKMFKIYGRTTQDGEPTPENPVPIKNTGDNGSVNEKIEGKNKLDYTKVKSGGGTPVTLIKNGFNAKGKFAGQIVVEGLKKNTNYYLSYIRQIITGSVTAIAIYAGTTQSTTVKNLSGNGTFNTGNNTTVNIWFYVGDGTNSGEANFTNIQLEEGTVKTDYTEYKAPQTLSFPLAQGQKLMEGDYPDDDEKVHHNRMQIVLDGSDDEVFDKRTDTNEIRYYLPINMKLSGRILTNYFMQRQSSSDKNYVRAVGTEPVNQIMFKSELLNTDEMTIPEWRQWLSTHNLIIEYELAEEQTEDFTEEQKTAWEQIKALRTYKPVTHISSEDETPAELKIQYWKEV